MRPKRRGFTLTELLIVITIIGIILSFIIRASMGTIRAAEKSATIALITQLDTAINDRLDALVNMSTNTRIDGPANLSIEPTWCHRLLAASYPASGGWLESNQRAMIIAKHDHLRAELPEVFVVDDPDGNYPLSFGAPRFNPNPITGALTGTDLDYALPLGAGIAPPLGFGFSTLGLTGIKGASFMAAAGLYRQLGYGPNGTNGTDDSVPPNFLIDEQAEGFTGLSFAEQQQIKQRLSNHRHKTARSEVLYAMLIEGTSPLGSVLNKEDIDPQFIKDTDNDGLLEFVDPWGEPLQFYRQPIMYRSDSQKGFPDSAKIASDTLNGVPIGPYSTVYEPREQDPIDPNQTLQAPGWWGGFNASYPWGSPRNTFASLFHTLVDPLAASGTVTSNATYWDRSTDPAAGYYTRRAYYSRFLILSGGPDKQPGTAMLGVNYQALDERSVFPTPTGSSSTRDASGALVPLSVDRVIQIENQGGRIDPNRNAAGSPPLNAGRNDTNTLLEDFGHDDITNHNLHSPGGPLPSPGGK